jgi:hypothetical protein
LRSTFFPPRNKISCRVEYFQIRTTVDEFFPQKREDYSQVFMYFALNISFVDGVETPESSLPPIPNPRENPNRKIKMKR